MPRIITVNFKSDDASEHTARDLRHAITTVAPYMVDNVDVQLYGEATYDEARTTISELQSFIQTFEGEWSAFDSNSGHAGYERYQRISNGLDTLLDILLAR